MVKQVKQLSDLNVLRIHFNTTLTKKYTDAPNVQRHEYLVVEVSKVIITKVFNYDL